MADLRQTLKTIKHMNLKDIFKKQPEINEEKEPVMPWPEYIGDDYWIWHCGLCGAELEGFGDDVVCARCGRMNVH